MTAPKPTASNVAQIEQLPRKLGLIDTASLLIGTVIGGGIFLVPGLISRSVRSTTAIILLWIFGGVLSFFGALAYAELGTMFPATGGQYVFLRESFGPVFAFLFGWTTFVVVMPAQIGSLAVGFSIYLGHFWTMPAVVSKAVAVAIILALAATNYVGVRSAAGVQNTCTMLKLAGLAIITASAFLWRSNGSEALHSQSASMPLWTGLGMALVPCLLSYDGWNTVSFLAGEIREPQRNFPRALATGIGIVALTYVLFNLAVLHVLSFSEIQSSERVGAALAQRTLGSTGAALVTLTILFSVAGSLNSALMTPPRLYFAQARDGLLFRPLGRVHPRFQTPSVAIVFQAVLGAAAAIAGTFETLITCAIFSGWLFYVLTVTGVMRLRRRRPELPRPYRMLGYPFTAIAFLLAAGAFLLITLWAQPKQASAALALVLAGLPAYWLWRRRE